MVTCLLSVLTEFSIRLDGDFCVFANFDCILWRYCFVVRLQVPKKHSKRLKWNFRTARFSSGKTDADEDQDEDSNEDQDEGFFFSGQDEDSNEDEDQDEDSNEDEDQDEDSNEDQDEDLNEDQDQD
jgi:hypothetical protein